MKPEQTKLALTLADGSLAIMSFVTRGFTPSGEVHFERELTESAARAEFAKAGLDVARWRVVSDEDIPADRTYRDAWCDEGHCIGHDMTRARECHRRRLRVERAPLLAALDVEYQRADESGDSARKRRVAAEKQRLRDITADPRIDAARTIDDLRCVQCSGTNAGQ